MPKFKDKKFVHNTSTRRAGARERRVMTSGWNAQAFQPHTKISRNNVILPDILNKPAVVKVELSPKKRNQLLKLTANQISHHDLRVCFAKNIYKPHQNNRSCQSNGGTGGNLPKPIINIRGGRKNGGQNDN